MGNEIVRQLKATIRSLTLRLERLEGTCLATQNARKLVDFHSITSAPYRPETAIDLALERPFPMEDSLDEVTTTAKELATMLTGREYRSETTPQERKLAAESGLVIIYGASDDLMEFEGAVSEEVGAYQGTIAIIDVIGVQADWNEMDDRERRDIDFMRAYFLREGNGREIEAIWDRDGYSWTFKTDIPHETFEIVEDGEPYCRGIVFRLADCAVAKGDSTNG